MVKSVPNADRGRVREFHMVKSVPNADRGEGVKNTKFWGTSINGSPLCIGVMDGRGQTSVILDLCGRLVWFP